MELRERILRAAAQLYAETGFRGATTRRIAQRAGVNEITLFRHFGSKTQLLREAIKDAGTATNLCRLPARPVEPREELIRWALGSHRYLFERRSLIRTAMGETEERPDLIPAEQSPTVCAGHALRAYLEQLRAGGLISPEVDVSAATTMFLSTIFSDAMSRDILPGMYAHPPEQSIVHYVDLFLRAIGLREREL